MYVYSNAARTADSLVCDSRNQSVNTSLDTCELNGTSFISVVGISDAQFTITTSTQDPAPVVVDTQSGPADVVAIVDVTDVVPVITTSGGGSAGGGGAFGWLTVLLFLPAVLRRQLLRRRPAPFGNGVVQ